MPPRDGSRGTVTRIVCAPLRMRWRWRYSGASGLPDAKEADLDQVVHRRLGFVTHTIGAHFFRDQRRA
jgi:hypothetical protein